MLSPSNRHISKNTAGFTLVELLIAIVVIAILAAISVVAFNGIQERARDSQRKHEVQTIARALEMYYSEHGTYPIITGTYYWTAGYQMDGNMANTFVTDSWNELEQHLSPYVEKIGSDPKNHRGLSGIGHANRYGYEYQSQPGSERCNVPRRSGQTYQLYYKLESEPQTHTVVGNCTYLAPNSSVYSSYTVVKPR